MIHTLRQTSSSSLPPNRFIEDHKQINLCYNYSKPVPTSSKPCPNLPASSNSNTPTSLNNLMTCQAQNSNPQSINTKTLNHKITTCSPMSHTSNKSSNQNTTPSPRGIQKKKKHSTSCKQSHVSTPFNKKSRISVSVSDLIRVMPLPQTVAARELGISLSTLKRRFYELNMGRWPGLVTGSSSNTVHHHFTQHIDDGSSSNSNESVSSVKKAELSYVLNSCNLEANFMDQITLAVLNIAFKQNL